MCVFCSLYDIIKRNIVLYRLSPSLLISNVLKIYCIFCTLVMTVPASWTFAVIIKTYQYNWAQFSPQSTHWILYYADGDFIACVGMGIWALFGSFSSSWVVGLPQPCRHWWENWYLVIRMHFVCNNVRTIPFFAVITITIYLILSSFFIVPCVITGNFLLNCLSSI